MPKTSALLAEWLWRPIQVQDLAPSEARRRIIGSRERRGFEPHTAHYFFGVLFMGKKKCSRAPSFVSPQSLFLLVVRAPSTNVVFDFFVRKHRKKKDLGAFFSKHTNALQTQTRSRRLFEASLERERTRAENKKTAQSCCLRFRSSSSLSSSPSRKKKSNNHAPSGAALQASIFRHSFALAGHRGKFNLLRVQERRKRWTFRDGFG